MDDAQQGVLFLFNWGVFDPVCFDFPYGAIVQFDVSLGVKRGGGGGRGVLSGDGSPQSPPCLRNRLLPNSVYSALGLLGVTDSLPVDLEDLDARDGWILESRID